MIPSVVYTDPEVAWVGLTEDLAKVQGIKVKKGLGQGKGSLRAAFYGLCMALDRPRARVQGREPCAAWCLACRAFGICCTGNPASDPLERAP